MASHVRPIKFLNIKIWLAPWNRRGALSLCLICKFSTGGDICGRVVLYPGNGWKIVDYGSSLLGAIPGEE